MSVPAEKPLSKESQEIIDRVLERLAVCDKCPDFDPDGTFSPLEHRIMVLESSVARLTLKAEKLDKLQKGEFEVVHKGFIQGYEETTEKLEAAVSALDRALGLLKALYPCYPDGCEVCPPEDQLDCEACDVAIEELKGDIDHPHKQAELFGKVWDDLRADLSVGHAPCSGEASAEEEKTQ
jgi:hypothetical protein